MSCSCNQAVTLCPKAEELWKEVTRFYRVHGDGTDEAFDAALAEYHKHFIPIGEIGQ